MSFFLGSYKIPHDLYEVSDATKYINQVLTKQHHNRDAEAEYISYLRKRVCFKQQFPKEYSKFKDSYKDKQPSDKRALQTSLFRTITEGHTSSSSSSYRNAASDYYKLYGMAEAYDKLVAQKPTSTTTTFSMTVNDKRSSEHVIPVTSMAATVHGTGRPVVQDLKPEQLKFLSEDFASLKQQTQDQAEQITKLQASNHEQEKLIEDLRTRLSGVASKKLVEGNPNFTDLSDKNRPIKLGEYFHAIYDDEWTNVLEVLTTKKFKMGEEEGIHLLSEILKEIYHHCCGVATAQITETVMTILMPGITSKQNHIDVEKVPKTDDLESRIGSIRREYSKESLPFVLQSFKDKTKLSEKYRNLGEIDKYIKKCVEVIWLMRLKDPPMVLNFAERGQDFNIDLYNHYHSKGMTVAYCVWPVLLLHERGPIINKGYAKPM